MNENGKIGISGQECNDRELAVRSQDGDRDAFSILVSRYHRPMRNIVMAICPNRTDIEDICQESFRKAFLAIQSYNPEFPFRNWLFSIAQNTAKDHLRKKSNYSTVKIPEGDEQITETDQTEDSPEDNLIDEQSYRLFLQAIEILSPKYRRVAELRFIHDLSYEDIANETGLPLNTVRTHIRRARIKIKEIMTEDTNNE